MTDCPCWNRHVWMDENPRGFRYCAHCDCHILCPDCNDTRPALGLIHQCRADPKGR